MGGSGFCFLFVVCLFVFLFLSPFNLLIYFLSIYVICSLYNVRTISFSFFNKWWIALLTVVHTVCDKKEEKMFFFWLPCNMMPLFTIKNIWNKKITVKLINNDNDQFLVCISLVISALSRQLQLFTAKKNILVVISSLQIYGISVCRMVANKLQYRHAAGMWAKRQKKKLQGALFPNNSNAFIVTTQVIKAFHLF